MAIQITSLVDEITGDSFPGIPDWLEGVDHVSDGGDIRELPQHIQDVIYLHFRAKSGNMESAEELAVRYEAGTIPCIGPESLKVGMDWHAFAVTLGSSRSALRLAQLNEWLFQDSGGKAYRAASDKMAVKAIELVLSGRRRGRMEETMIAMVAAKLLLGRDCQTDEVLRVIAMLVTDEHCTGHPDLAWVTQQLRQLNCKNGNDPLSVQVIDSTLTDDHEFKAGIYKRLQKPLPLVPAPHDPEFILENLNQEFPWFCSINEEIYKQLVVAGHAQLPAFRIRPLLLAGPPGCGKTTWTKRLAQLAGVPMWPVMAAGGADSMFLRGTPRGWSSARPGAVLQAMVSDEIANPLFVLDELEKASDDHRNGRLWDTLLQLIEPATAVNYLDECLQVKCNLSWVNWIGTCNTLGRLPRPLIERFTVMLVELPGEEHFDALVTGVTRQFAAELGMDVRMLPAFDREDLAILRQCRSPREINRVGRMIIEDRLVHARRHASRM